jgi:hypothetical protein
MRAAIIEASISWVSYHIIALHNFAKLRISLRRACQQHPESPTAAACCSWEAPRAISHSPAVSNTKSAMVAFMIAVYVIVFLVQRRSSLRNSLVLIDNYAVRVTETNQFYMKLSIRINLEQGRTLWWCAGKQLRLGWSRKKLTKRGEDCHALRVLQNGNTLFKCVAVLNTHLCEGPADMHFDIGAQTSSDSKHCSAFQESKRA